MKRTFLALSLLITITITFSNTITAQKSFEGIITYTIEYEDLPEEMQGMEAMLPKETIIKIKGYKTRTEQSMGMGKTISIIDAKLKTSVTLMDMMGNKVAIKTPKEEIEKVQDKEPKITYSSETKKIAGYSCKKATIKYEEQEEVIVYYTESIIAKKAKSQFRGLKGFPLSYEVHTDGMNMIMTASKVEEKKLSSSKFEIPEEYKIMTMEEFQKSMSGMGNK